MILAGPTFEAAVRFSGQASSISADLYVNGSLSATSVTLGTAVDQGDPAQTLQPLSVVTTALDGGERIEIRVTGTVDSASETHSIYEQVAFSQSAADGLQVAGEDYDQNGTVFADTIALQNDAAKLAQLLDAISASGVASSNMRGTDSALTSLGANAPMAWINEDAIAPLALTGKGDWSIHDAAAVAALILANTSNKIATDASGRVTVGSIIADAISAASLSSAAVAKIEAALLNEGDGQALIDAIVQAIDAADIDTDILPALVRDAILNRVLAGNHDTTGSLGKILQDAATQATAAAIQAKTDNLAFTGGDVHATLDGETVTTDTASRNASKADVSGLATASALATVSSNVSASGSIVTSIQQRLGSWTGSARNTVLGAMQALFRKDADASVPSDINADLGNGAGGANNTTDSLEAIRDNQSAGGGGGGSSPWSDAQRDEVLGDLDTLITRTAGGVSVTITAPLIDGETMSDLVQGDAYLAIDNRAITIDLEAHGLTLTGATATITIRSRADGSEISSSGAITEDGADASIVFELQATDTATLALGSAVWDFQLTLATPSRPITPTRGEVQILEQIS